MTLPVAGDGCPARAITARVTSAAGTLPLASRRTIAQSTVARKPWTADPATLVIEA